MESGGSGRSGGSSSSRSARTGGTGSVIGRSSGSSRGDSGSSRSNSGTAGSLGRSSSIGGSGGIIVAAPGAGGVAPAPPCASEWEMFQFGKYNLDIIEMLSGHQAHQFKGLGLERQLQHQQQVQLHQHQLQQQQQQQAETSGALLSGLGLGSLQGARSNAFSDSASIFAKMSAPPPPPLQQQPSSSSHSSRSKSSKMSSSSSSHVSGYPQFLRSFHPTEAALAQEQLHSGVGRFEHFSGGSSGGGAGGLGLAPPPPPPLHPGLSVPQASPGPSSSSPSPSSSVVTNNPPSSSAVTSLGHQLVGAQSDARSLHQQFSCMLAANQYFLSGVPANASLEQFLVQQGTHNHLGIGLAQSEGSSSGLAPPPALHSSHSHGLSTAQPQQQPPQQQQLPPHTLSHPHSHSHPHHPLHPGSQPSSLGGFDFQGIPVLSSNQLASLMQQEAGLPLPLPLHLSLSKDDGKGDSSGGGSSSSRRKKAMAGYLPQRKSDGGSNSSSGHSSGNPNASSSAGGLGHDPSPGLVGGGGGGVGMSGLGGDPSLLASSSSSSSVVSSSSSSGPSSTAASVLVTNGSHLSKPDNMGSMPSASTQADTEPLYNCGECGKTFTHLSSLRRHLRMHESTAAGTSNNVSINPNPTHIQPLTDPTLPHSTQEHSTQDLNSQSNSLSSQQSSNSVQASSSCPSPDKTFNCSDCGKHFKKKGHLLQHGVIHSEARPYGCSICSRAFNRRESLTRHEKIHQDKPFRCPACGRCFRESTSLLNHAASGTCGKPGRASKPQGSSKEGAVGEGRMGGGGGGEGGGGGDYQGSRGVIYGKTEEDEEGVIMGGEGGQKSRLGCDGGLFQSERGGNANSRDRPDGKYPTDYSRNRYTGYHDDHRSQGNPSPCYSGASPCGSGMVGPALRKAPLAPTLHPHPQSQTQHHHQQHLPLSSLLDDSEDDVTSSVNNAISAIAAAAAANCDMNSGNRGDDRRDIIGGLLGGLDLGPLGSPSSTSGMDKTYRGAGNQDGMSGNVNHNQQQGNDPQNPAAKPKRTRKPRKPKDPNAPPKRRQYTPRAPRESSNIPRPYLCSVCGRGFARRETLRRHDRVHTGEKPHRCSTCGKHFREAFHLTKHHTVHSGEKNYKCSLCGKEFGYSQSLKRHGKLHQKGELEEVPTTPGGENLNNFNTNPSCGMGQDREQNQGNSSSSYYSYPQDVKPQGSNSQPPPRLYTCAICWKSFRHHFHLTAHHQTVHENGGEKLFSCEVCGKAFAYSNSLTRHRLSQHGLARTGPDNAQGDGSGSGVNSAAGGGVSGTASESEAATNALLQMAPSTEGHGGQQSHSVVTHSHQQQPPQPPAGYSPLFYDAGTAHSSASSVPPYSQPLPPNSTIMPPQHQHSPARVKGEHIYPAGSSSHTLHTTAPFQPLTELPSDHHHHHHHHHSSHHHHRSEPQSQQPHPRNIQSHDDMRRHKKKRKSDRREGRGDMWGESSGFVRDEVRKDQRKRRSVLQKQLRKKKLLLKIRRGGGAGGGGYELVTTRGMKIQILSSLKVPVKRFSCSICPHAMFARQAGLLAHRAAKHTQRVLSPQERLCCGVCGKQSHRLLEAFIHRATHRARGSFSCRRCSARFWNAPLLRRHKVTCRHRAKGLPRGGAIRLKLSKRAGERKSREEQGEMSHSLLTLYRY
ncbi:uncharacterized protein LOC116352817 isoform X1 [Oncorhynchus kisutch]|uniref:uncharacterized protein LOC116352817 isoform X1 n=2 Tax=Oncorhynchus TaxID=8016 RepID=UPI0012DE3AD3|nr:uncharacterized protein LOC116352817 isoform X1 [Oncorhynchus kisutch]